MCACLLVCLVGGAQVVSEPAWWGPLLPLSCVLRVLLMTACHFFELRSTAARQMQALAPQLPRALQLMASDCWGLHEPLSRRRRQPGRLLTRVRFRNVLAGLAHYKRHPTLTPTMTKPRHWGNWYSTPTHKGFHQLTSQGVRQHTTANYPHSTSTQHEEDSFTKHLSP